jgi:hypothetical protein
VTSIATDCTTILVPEWLGPCCGGAFYNGELLVKVVSLTFEAYLFIIYNSGAIGSHVFAGGTVSATNLDRLKVARPRPTCELTQFLKF